MNGYTKTVLPHPTILSDDCSSHPLRGNKLSNIPWATFTTLSTISHQYTLFWWKFLYYMNSLWKCASLNTIKSRLGFVISFHHYTLFATYQSSLTFFVQEHIYSPLLILSKQSFSFPIAIIIVIECFIKHSSHLIMIVSLWRDSCTPCT